MANRSRTRTVAAEDLRAAFEDWRKKERRFNTLSTGKRQYSESVIDEAARAAEGAFALIHSRLLHSTGARRDQDCAAIFPDGSHLVVVIEHAGPAREKSVTIRLIPRQRVARLS